MCTSVCRRTRFLVVRVLFRGSVCAQTSVSTRHKNFFITFSFSRRALFSKPRFDSSCVFVQNQSECVRVTRQSTCRQVHQDPSRRRRQESKNIKTRIRLRHKVCLHATSAKSQQKYSDSKCSNSSQSRVHKHRAPTETHEVCEG